MRWAGVLAAVLLVAGCSSSSSSAPSTRAPSDGTNPTTRASIAAPTGSPPALQHLVIVVEENRSYADLARSSSAPYLHELMAQGTTLTNFFAITHPSEPNYLALFSGSTQGLRDDSCPHTFSAANLAGELLAHHQTFAGFAEGLPSSGYEGCTHGHYARKHAPWSDFGPGAARLGRPLSDFPADYSTLPTVSYVIPDLDHDMHDGTIGQADTWLRAHLGDYVTWARTHHSALIVTWDEDDHSQDNQIPTLIVGAGVRAAPYRSRADLYDLLATIEWVFGLPPLGASGGREPLSAIWAS
jgi:acid phosphatase